MKLTASTRHHHVPAKNPEIKQFSGPPAFFNNTSFHPSNYRNPSRICSSVRISNLRRSRLVTACITRGQETPFLEPQTEDELERFENIPSVSSTEEERETAEKAGPVSTRREEFAPNSSIWNQMVEIVKFSGPATGLWICGPLMSLIDTAVIGQGSSLDLAALGNGRKLFCVLP